MKSFFALAAAALAISTSPAAAQNYSTDQFTVGEFNDADGCYARGDWTLAGRSQINFEVWLFADGEVMVKLWSYGWSRPPKDANKVLGVVFWNASSEKDVYAMFAASTGAEIGEQPGLVAKLPPENRDAFLAAFSSSRSFTLLTRPLEAADDSSFVNILEGGLRGSSLALTRLRTCTSDVHRREEARRAREASVAHIAKDPFKPAE